jgi:hypothetical protein
VCIYSVHIESVQAKQYRSRPRYQPTLQPVSPGSHQSPPPSSSQPYSPHHSRRHQYLTQQLQALHFQLLIVAGHIADKIGVESNVLVGKVSAQAAAEIFLSRKSSAQGDKPASGSGIFVAASSNSKQSLATSLTSLSFPSIASYTNELMSPTPMTQKMVLPVPFRFYFASSWLLQFFFTSSSLLLRFFLFTCCRWIRS